MWIEYWERLEDYKRAKAQVEDIVAATAAAITKVLIDKEGRGEGETMGACEPEAVAAAAAVAAKSSIPARVKGRKDDD